MSLIKDINLTTGVENGHEYVDLGLSVKWATYNIGATKPEEYGDYFAWGETKEKTCYEWENYKFFNDIDEKYNIVLSKYITGDNSNDGFFGDIDFKDTLETIDDVANVKWGGNWRMPKLVEQQELCNKCKWIWTSINGIYGYLVTSNISGYTDRSIFLPAAGFYSYSNLQYTGELGYYWSNCLDYNRPDGALTIFMNPAFKSTQAMGRSSGLSVRPVCP